MDSPRSRIARTTVDSPIPKCRLSSRRHARQAIRQPSFSSTARMRARRRLSSSDLYSEILGTAITQQATNYLATMNSPYTVRCRPIILITLAIIPRGSRVCVNLVMGLVCESYQAN